MKKELVIANRRPSTDPVSPVPHQAMHKRTVIGVAAVALLAACTTSPMESADYPADRKKYDDCVATERDRNAGSVASTYIESSIRNNCGYPPTPQRGEKK